MNDRYSRVFRLPDELYLAGSPVLIAAGALLLDQRTGGVVAQLKLRNIGDKNIRTVKAVIEPLDSMDRPLNAQTEYEYLDLYAARDEEFGQKKPIRLSAPTARAFRARIAEVGFTDKTVWTPAEGEWTPIPKSETLETHLQDAALVKQYRLEFGPGARYLPVSDRDVYRCFCGAINRKEEPNCHRCGAAQSYDPAALIERCAARLAEEARKAKEEAEARAAKARKTRKRLAIAIPSVVVVVAAVLLLTLVVLPNMRYNKAVELAQAENYEQAIAAFEALGDYKNSEEWLEYARSSQALAEAYQSAVRLMDEGNYTAATNAFAALGDYRDSKEKCQEANNRVLFSLYQKADEQLKNGEYLAAYRAFESLGDYLDSAEKRNEAIENAYQEAKRLAEAGDYESAYLAFESLGNYRDSAEQRDELAERAFLSPLLKYEGTYSNEKNETLTLSFRIIDGTVYACLEKGTYEWSGKVENGLPGKYDYAASMTTSTSTVNVWLHIKENSLEFNYAVYEKN